MFSLLLRNLFFTLLLPGMVAGYIPWRILGDQAGRVMTAKINPVQYLAIPLFLTGIVILLTCIFSFARVGRGTLAPVDPTKHLVTTGFYRFSRNPMYAGVMLVLTGEAVFFRSGSLWIYLISVFVLFNLFILAIEEPRLRRDFTLEYDDYCRKVRRWI